MNIAENIADPRTIEAHHPRSFPPRTAPGRTVSLQTAKTHCEKKDRGSGTPPSIPPEPPAHAARSSCSSAPAADSASAFGLGATSSTPLPAERPSATPPSSESRAAPSCSHSIFSPLLCFADSTSTCPRTVTVCALRPRCLRAHTPQRHQPAAQATPPATPATHRSDQPAFITALKPLASQSSKPSKQNSHIRFKCPAPFCPFAIESVTIRRYSAENSKSDRGR